MLKKIKIILVFISLSISLCLMSNTYSRYVSDATGNVELSFANWQILVNSTDITNNISSSLTFVPVIEQNANVKPGVIAPASKGYFDINIDPSNVDVSFAYTITLGIANENMPDLMITKYAIVPNDYVEGNALELITIEENEITNTLTYDNETNNFKFSPIKIRVYFEWYEGENEAMDDNADTIVGQTAANEDTTFTISANINFQQVIEEVVEQTPSPVETPIVEEIPVVETENQPQ